MQKRKLIVNVKTDPEVSFDMETRSATFWAKLEETTCKRLLNAEIEAALAAVRKPKEVTP